MSTQSDYINGVQTTTAQFRGLLLQIDPLPAYTDRQKHDRAQVAVRDVTQLCAVFDQILEAYIERVEEECGPMSKAARAEIKDCFAGVAEDTVLPGFKDLATRLGEEIEYRAPYASERLNARSQGVREGRAHG